MIVFSHEKTRLVHDPDSSGEDLSTHEPLTQGLFENVKGEYVI
jgi:hypothetical protein